jgi:hypothetical protein
MSMLTSGQEMHTKVQRYFYLAEIHFVLPKSHDDVTKSHHQLSGQELINGNNQMLWTIVFFFFLANWDKISPSTTRRGVSSSNAPDIALE